MRFLISKKRGFTMVELLVAVAIVSLLGAVVLGTLQAGRMKARDSQRISDLGQIQVALRLYRDAYSVGHPNSAGEALTSSSATGALISSNLASFPMDPSGTSYYYDSVYMCNGVPRPVLIALAMERENAGNFASVCGTSYAPITNGVTPTEDSFVVILK